MLAVPNAPGMVAITLGSALPLLPARALVFSSCFCHFVLLFWERKKLG
jgi:hypothetical protein